MRTRNAVWLGVVVIAFYGLFFVSTRPHGSSHHETLLVQNDPEQININPGDQDEIKLTLSGIEWKITVRAEYRIAARILHRERYYLGWQSSFSPVDLALGWGELADPKADQWISWSQNMRWYFYRWNGEIPYSTDYILRHSANVHIVPADNNLKRAVLELARNDLVLLQGDLVDIDGRKGSSTYWWHTSLTREDSGDGSCELLWLKRAVFHNTEYN
jgi:hypothetical protein